MNTKSIKFIENLASNGIFLICIIIIGAITLGLYGFFSCDYTPATKEDYIPLLEIQETLINDFDDVYNYPYAYINVLEDNISVSVGNEECSLKIIFDKNKNYLYSEKNDKVMPLFVIILLTILSALGGALLSVFITIVVLAILSNFFEWLYKIRNKKKKPYDNINNSYIED